jgi:hypothetical protein
MTMATAAGASPTKAGTRLFAKVHPRRISDVSACFETIVPPVERSLDPGTPYEFAMISAPKKLPLGQGPYRSRFTGKIPIIYPFNSIANLMIRVTK